MLYLALIKYLLHKLLVLNYFSTCLGISHNMLNRYASKPAGVFLLIVVQLLPFFLPSDILLLLPDPWLRVGYFTISSDGMK